MKGAVLALACLAVAPYGARQQPQKPGANAVTLTYRAATEDDASSGRLRFVLAANRIDRAVIWERECTMSARQDADRPDVDADQYWTFRLELTTDAAGRPAARVRYRAVKSDATAKAPAKDEEKLVKLDGKDTLAIDAFSARTDCRYDRIHLSVSGG